VASLRVIKQDIMGDVEEIIAEPEEGPGFLQESLMQAHLFITSYGWFILAAAAGAYYLWKNNWKNRAQTSFVAQSPDEIAAFQAKEEARLKAVQRLQEKYEKEAAERAEKLKKLDDEKKKARLIELEALDAKGGKILGSKSSKSASFRPEYNPLMGDASSSDRVCYRRPGGTGG